MTIFYYTLSKSKLCHDKIVITIQKNVLTIHKFIKNIYKYWLNFYFNRNAIYMSYIFRQRRGPDHHLYIPRGWKIYCFGKRNGCVYLIPKMI